jgi:arsenate reductase
MLIKSSNDEIVLVYNSDTQVGKSCYNNAQELGLPIKEVDLAHRHITGTQWFELADAVGMKVQDLIDDEHESAEELLKGSEDFTEMDWMKILDHNPLWLKHPIAIRGDKAILCYSPSEVLQL